jgi:hypothetical protein
MGGEEMAMGGSGSNRGQSNTRNQFLPDLKPGQYGGQEALRLGLGLGLVLDIILTLI